MKREPAGADNEVLAETQTLEYDLVFACAPFNRLLASCVETYLDDPTSYEAALAESTAPFYGDQSEDPNSALLRQLGTRGLQAAHIMSGKTTGIATTNPWLEESVRQPELYTPPADPWIARRIHAFGTAYLQEMYNSVGEPAPDHNTQLNTDEQLALLRGLEQKILTIGDVPDAPPIPFYTDEIASMQSSGGYHLAFYDPLRLSPRAFPNSLGITPTCAAQAAMTAGFLEAAGWKHMLANTTTSGEVYGATVLRTLLDDFAAAKAETNPEFKLTVKDGNIVPTEGLGIPVQVRRILHELRNNADDFKELDPGFHACNLVKLADDGWWQIDMTRSIYHKYDDATSRILDAAYDRLHEAERHRVPAAEYVVTGGFEQLTTAIADMQAATEPIAYKKIVGKLTQMLSRPSLKAVADQLIVPAVLDVLIPGKTAGIDPAAVQAILDRLMPKKDQTPKNIKAFASQLATSLMAQHGVVDVRNTDHMGLSTKHSQNHAGNCTDKCLASNLSSDEGRKQIVRLLRHAPTLFFAKLAGDLINSVYERGAQLPHPSLEITAPVMQIGALVMSNYAAIYATPEEKLPAAWWVAYDPTHTGGLIHMHDSPETASQPMTTRTVNWLLHLPAQPLGGLHDSSKRSRMREFLEDEQVRSVE